MAGFGVESFTMPNGVRLTVSAGTGLRGLGPQVKAAIQGMLNAATAAGVTRIDVTAGAEGGHRSHYSGVDFDIKGYSDAGLWNPAQRATVLEGAMRAGADRFGLYSAPGAPVGNGTAHVGFSGAGRPASVWGRNQAVEGPGSRPLGDPAERQFLAKYIAAYPQSVPAQEPNTVAAAGQPVDGVQVANAQSGAPDAGSVPLPRVSPAQMAMAQTAPPATEPVSSSNIFEDYGRAMAAEAPPAVTPYVPSPPPAPAAVAVNDMAQGTPPVAEPASLDFGDDTPAGLSVRVNRGDTLWGMAQKYYGDGTRWTEIQAANGGVDPNRLLPGMVLQVPGVSGPPTPVARPSTAVNVLPAQAPAAAPAPPPAPEPAAPAPPAVEMPSTKYYTTRVGEDDGVGRLGSWARGDPYDPANYNTDGLYDGNTDDFNPQDVNRSVKTVGPQTRSPSTITPPPAPAPTVSPTSVANSPPNPPPAAPVRTFTEEERATYPHLTATQGQFDTRFATGQEQDRALVPSVWDRVTETIGGFFADEPATANVPPAVDFDPPTPPSATRSIAPVAPTPTKDQSRITPDLPSQKTGPYRVAPPKDAVGGTERPATSSQDFVPLEPSTVNPQKPPAGVSGLRQLQNTGGYQYQQNGYSVTSIGNGIATRVPIPSTSTTTTGPTAVERWSPSTQTWQPFKPSGGAPINNSTPLTPVQQSNAQGQNWSTSYG